MLITLQENISDREYHALRLRCYLQQMGNLSPASSGLLSLPGPLLVLLRFGLSTAQHIALPSSEQ
jgi:hypothetical protein